LELAQLEVFLMVAREHRFSRAAEKLFRTQSAVSQTIRKLEVELGEALFDRSSREGVLTDAGKVLVEYAEKLLNLRSEAAESLVELRELQKGKLVIAANEFTALYLLPILAEFRRLHPMIKITVQRALGSHIPDDVLRYRAEFGVLSYEPQEPSVHSIVVYLDELVFVVPPKHPLAAAKQVSIRQLGAESFVAHIVSSPYRDKVLQLFKTHKTPAAHGPGTPNFTGHQAVCGSGKRGGIPSGNQRRDGTGAGRTGAHPGSRAAIETKAALDLPQRCQSFPRRSRAAQSSGSRGARAQRPLPFPARELTFTTKE
jgi:DNA-binding transcriptional LysR family regulator